MHFSRVRATVSFLCWSFLFGISSTQAPLYYSNQNQYFLHGLAEAGRADLDQDWLANTKDPTPVFSGVVAVTAKYLHEWLFYLYYLLIQGLYCYCLVGLFTVLAPATPDKRVRLCFITLFVVLHAGVLRLASTRLLGVDYPWYFQAGVAGQYLLGFGLQPSVCGVFLIASILAFLRERPWQAMLWACMAAVLHGTYLPAAAFLTLAYMVVRYRQRGFREAVLVGGWALVLVMPTVIYTLVTFAPSSSEDFAQAQRIVVQIRIPHHAVIERWFDGIALGQVLWIALATFLVRRSDLFLMMLIPFVCSLVLTLIQLATGNDTLALLFPWRTSALLVPIATTIILARAVFMLGPWLQQLAPARGAVFHGMCGFILGVCVVGGLAIPFFELGYQTNRDEIPLLEFVKKNHQRGAVYLVPVEVPRPGEGPRGAASTNFRPALRSGKAGGLIAIDLQGFRITTGAPLYVDFKSIPYKDEEVLEWYRRVLWSKDIYASRGVPAESLGVELTGKGITHVVAPSASILPFAALGPPVYQDTAYCVYAVAKK